MTTRNIELQIALPKVTEVTKIQQQIQQQHLNQQAGFEQAIQKQTEKELKRPNGFDQNRAVSDRKQHAGSPPQKRRRRNQSGREREAQPEPSHPYKGKHIDIRG